MQNEFIQKLLVKWEAFTQTQKVTAILCAVLALVLVVIIGVAVSSTGKSKDAVGTENTQGTESFATEELFETEATETTEVEDVIEIVSVAMTATSMEKDLKIKIVDESNTLIAGQPFVITVTPEGKNAGTDYNDHDMDGIIYIKSLAAGKYTVQLQELEGFVVTENPISAVVKDKIVYQKVEIENEIKDESQIDASKEDTANKDVEAENEIVNTLPLLESTVTAAEVEKEKVDFSNFPEAEVSSDCKVTLYSYGKDASKNIELNPGIETTTGTVKDVVWSVDASDVVEVKVSEDKKTCFLTAKTEGQAKLTITISYEINGQDAAIVTTATGEEESSRTSIQTKDIIYDIAVTDYTDDKTQLQDVDGNLLYLDKEGKNPATPKEFVVAEKFYTSPKYTGWQTIDGKLYYYKEDHTVATGRQVIGGVTYDFNEDGSLIEKAETIGIDVSKWNGEIDWKAVAGAGVDFAIIRCGYRGSATGALVEDPYFKQNIAGATQNGIKVGVYFFTQAVSEAEAVEEASMAISLVQGYHLQLPIFIDTEESGGRGDKLTKAQRTSVVKAFCETVKNAGFRAGVYASKSWYEDSLNAGELSSYHIWVARYATECGYTGHYDIWQHTDKGTIPGIKGKVDLNICYTSYY